MLGLNPFALATGVSLMLASDGIDYKCHCILNELL